MRKKPRKAAKRKTTPRKAATRKTTRRVVKKAKRPATRPGAKAWSAAEVTKLRKMYKTKTATEIAKNLRRSLSSVKSKCRAMGLRKTAAAKKSITRRRATTRRTAPKRKATTRRTTTRRKATPRRKTPRRRR